MCNSIFLYLTVRGKRQGDGGRVGCDGKDDDVIAVGNEAREGRDRDRDRDKDRDREEGSTTGDREEEMEEEREGGDREGGDSVG